MSLDLNKLANKLDEALSNETTESLTNWLEQKRKNSDNLSSVEWLITELEKFELGTSEYYTKAAIKNHARRRNRWEIEDAYDHMRCVGNFDTGKDYYNGQFGDQEK